MSWSSRSTLVVIAVCGALGVAWLKAYGRGGNAGPPGHGPLPVDRRVLSVRCRGPQLVPQDLARTATSRRSTSSAARRTFTAGRRPVRPSSARRTRRTRRVCSCAGRPRPRTSAATSSSRCSTRPTCFDLNIGWAMAHRQIVRNGDAWVGITVKPIAVEALKNFDPERYALAVVRQPAAARRSAQLVTVAVADSSRATENGLVWDIYSQVGAWLSSRDRANPLGYAAKRRGGSRWSTSTGSATRRRAGTSYNYINGIHPLVVRRRRRADLRRLHRRRRRRRVRGRRADEPVRGRRRRSATPAGSSPTSACRSSTSCRSPTTCSASRPAVPTATRPPTGSATTRWPAPATRRRTSSTSPRRPRTSCRPARRAADGLQRGPAQPLPEPHLLRRRRCATSTSGCVRASRRRTPTRSQVAERRRPCSTVRQRRRAACARPTSTCRPAPGSGTRPAPRSASSPATRCRSARRG